MAEPLRKLSHPKSQRARAAARAEPAPRPPKSALRDYGEAIVIAFILAVIIRTFLVQAYKIPSGSMEPTLLIGDHIMVNKLAYGLRLPDSFFGAHPLAGEISYGHYLLRLGKVHRGDVVVFVFPPDPSKDFIKRVIGIPGDRIAVKKGVVYLNGAKMYDPHAHYVIPMALHDTNLPRDNFGPVTVPKGDYFMMGDNRDRSYDSRFWGYVPIDNIEGRAIFIYLSLEPRSTAWIPIRFGRFGKIIH